MFVERLCYFVFTKAHDAALVRMKKKAPVVRPSRDSVEVVLKNGAVGDVFDCGHELGVVGKELDEVIDV